MNAELEEHLGYEKHAVSGKNSGNNRNGHSSKTLKGDFGEVDIVTPRDRNGTFEPQIIRKGQTRVTAFDQIAPFLDIPNHWWVDLLCLPCVLRALPYPPLRSGNQ